MQGRDALLDGRVGRKELTNTAGNAHGRHALGQFGAVQATQAGQPSSGIRQLPRVVAVGGGVMIDSGGAIVGAIGVSGAPGGAEDEACAKAGIAAIRDALDF